MTDSELVIEKSQRTLVDYETGEMIHVDQVLKRQGGGSKQFWKMYLADFLAILGIFDSKQLDVFIYIAENTSQSNNVFLGTQRKIAEKVGCSPTTVSTIMRKLQEQGFIKMISPGAYFVNPNIIMKGNDHKRQMLITWEQSDFENDSVISMVRGRREAMHNDADMIQPGEEVTNGKRIGDRGSGNNALAD